MGMVCKVSTGELLCVQGRREGQMEVHTPYCEHVHNGVHQGLLPEKRGCQMERAICMGITDSHRPHHPCATTCRFEKSRIEGFERRAVRCSAFRKERHTVLLVQGVGNHGGKVSHLPLIATLQKKRTGLCGQPSDDWPLTDFGLGHKAHPAKGVEGNNIQP